MVLIQEYRDGAESDALVPQSDFERRADRYC